MMQNILGACFDSQKVEALYNTLKSMQLGCLVGILKFSDQQWLMGQISCTFCKSKWSQWGAEEADEIGSKGLDSWNLYLMPIAL